MEINSLHLPKPIKNQFPIQICAQSLMATLTPLSLPLSLPPDFLSFSLDFFHLILCIAMRQDSIWAHRYESFEQQSLRCISG